ncbi:MAG: LytR C-terminal domain-containing protein [candidate division WOR-3 bacterium]
MKRYIFIPFLILFLVLLGKILFFKKKEKRVSRSYSEIKVEIINCSGRYEIGKEILEDLRQRGFNVYDVVFDQDTLSESWVVERSDEQGENALILAKEIAGRKKVGIFRKEILIMPKIKKEINRNLFIDVSLILGKDYKIFFPKVFSEKR